MKNRIFLISLIAVVLFLGGTAKSAINSISEHELELLINQTDQIKTSDSAQFNKNLSKLENYSSSAPLHHQEFIHYLAAYALILNGDMDKAQTDLKQLFLRANNLRVKIRIKATLANIQAISREYDQSLSNLDYAINHVSQTNDKKLIAKVNLISAIVYFTLEIYDMSLNYAQLVLKANPNGVMMCKASVYKFASLIMQNNHLAEEGVQDTIKLCNENSEIIYSSLLSLRWINKKLDDALEEKDTQLIPDLLQSVNLIENDIEKFGYKNLIGLKDMLLAKGYYHSGQVELALKSANKVVEGSLKSGNTSQVIEALRILQKEAVNINDYKKAFKLGSQINQVENEIFSEAKAKQMAFMTVKHNNLARQVEIQQLKQNNQVLSLENQLSSETSEKQKILMLLVVSIMSLLAIWTYKIKKKHDYFKSVSEVDHLTKVLTRKAFEEQMPMLLNRMKSSGSPICLAIMDLDRFKLVNDTHGHLIGDWVLKNVIYKCKEMIDENMMIARLGGEEFCIVMSELDEKSVLAKLEAMRHAIELMDCSASGAELSVTASFGVSSSDVSGYSMNMLLTHADVAMFEAKNQGRNQVVVYDASKSSVTTHHPA